MTRPAGLYILDQASFPMIYGPAEQADIAELVEFIAPPQTRDSIAANPGLLKDLEVLFSGWGAPLVDEAFLAAAPRLKAIFYAAGSVAGWITPAVWNRGIIVSSAYAANAVPVAEYAFAAIVLSLKHAWALMRQAREQQTLPPRDGAPGCYGSTVGLVSLGVAGRATARLLKNLNVRLLAFDPFVSGAEAQEMGVELVSLTDLFRRSDVVSVHTPLLTETAGLITGRHVECLKPGATLINTARGTIIRENEMIEVLRRRPDLQAVLDVTVDEPPKPSSPLYSLPNVTLTPHIAGSVGRECSRMGRYMVGELRRYLAGQPLHWAVTPELALHTSHRPVVTVTVPAASAQQKPAGTMQPS